MPSGFAVNDASLQAALAAHGEADSTLARAVAEGRLFLVDFAILEGLPLQEGPQKDFFGQAVWPEVTTKRYLPVPYALFYRAGDRLLTVAIQLGRDAAEFEVFTPADDPEVWRRVKTLYLCADFHHQELCTHLAQGHLRVDGFVIAMQRQLHQDHPLYALLKPFFYMHLWNDFAGRQFLYCAGGFLDQLLSPTIEGTLEVLNRRYPELTYDALHLPKWLKSRGLYDPDTLPVFPYRDDGLGIWGALRAFAGEYVDLYYASAEVMAADIELQAWLAELVDPSGADFRGLPAVDSPEALAELVTTMMFNSSAFHSAVNFSQFDTMARGIYTPSTTHIDPRTVRDVRWEDCLPGGETLTSHALIGWILVCQRSEHLTELDLDAFSDPAVWPVLARYRTALAALEAGQVKRNEGEWSYPWLLPSQVTQSASV